MMDNMTNRPLLNIKRVIRLGQPHIAQSKLEKELKDKIDAENEEIRRKGMAYMALMNVEVEMMKRVRRRRSLELKMMMQKRGDWRKARKNGRKRL